MHTMMVAEAWRAGGHFRLVERKVPEPGPREVRIKVDACGICHSDVFVRNAAFPGLRLPRVPGHEIAGRVDVVGAEVRGLDIGLRVGVGWHGGHCLACSSCRKGEFLGCASGRITGITHDGGYGQYVVVPVESIARIPEGLDAAEIAPLLCAGLTTYNALRNCGAEDGGSVAVQGIGGLGHLGLQYAARLGFRTIALSRGPEKEEMARHLGAHEYIDTERVDAAEGLQRLGGADVVLATAPSGPAIASTLGGLKPKGKLLIVAAPHDPLTISPFDLLSGRSIAGWNTGSPIEAEETIAFSLRCRVRSCVEVFRLDQVEEAFAKAMENRVRFRAVLVP